MMRFLRREWRKRLIFDLHDKGYSNKFIAEKLNQDGVKTPRGFTYTQKLIWITIKNMIFSFFRYINLYFNRENHLDYDA